ncbi:MAG: hypothetical protein ABXS91_08515 [Sulfurimonas sp.]
MQKPVSNLTDAPVTLGGVEVSAKGQRVVRESLITEDETKEIMGNGGVIEFKPAAITVKIKEDSDGQNASPGNNSTEPLQTKSQGVVHVAYPEKYIKNDGELSGTVTLQKAIEALQEEYGDKIVTDNEFIELYPEEDIEAYRVKEEDEQINK